MILFKIKIEGEEIMMFKVWYSTESFADFIINNTKLKDYKI